MGVLQVIVGGVGLAVKNSVVTLIIVRDRVVILAEVV
jgi:hypothetical protein